MSQRHGPDGGWSPVSADVDEGSTMEFGLLFLVIVPILGLALFALWIYALIDAIRTPEASFQTGTQLIWVLVILFGNVIGAIIYLVIGRPQRV